jgi:hypothetical protein
MSFQDADIFASESHTFPIPILSVVSEEKKVEDSNDKMNSTMESSDLLPPDVTNQVIKAIDTSTEELRRISMEVSRSHPIFTEVSDIPLDILQSRINIQGVQSF